MRDPRTLLLIVTNIVLGLLVVGFVVAIATGWLCEMVAKWKKRRSVSAELDRYEDQLFGAGHRRKR
jgi:putative effector of murein hydrolase LrgA (UPF0299 family)